MWRNLDTFFLAADGKHIIIVWVEFREEEGIGNKLFPMGVEGPVNFCSISPRPFTPWFADIYHLACALFVNPLQLKIEARELNVENTPPSKKISRSIE